MSGIKAHELKRNKTYKFGVHGYDILSDKEDRMPHYYEATYISRKGIKNSIWVFKNFTDTETKETRKKQEIKHLGLLNPNFELIIAGEEE